MNDQTKLLKDRVQVAKAQLRRAKADLEAAEALPKNNVFESLEEAEDELYEKLEDKANNDCEGAHNCGAREYIQLFYVDKTLYKAIATVEYNRHDKTYYYVDEFDFKIERAQE
jgi:hypothetical protein